MTDARTTFLKNAGWNKATASPVAGDLSSRQYTRLTKGNSTAILMKCDPATDTSLPNFVKMTNWLRDIHLSAPDLIAVDTSTGFALLEDFGNAKLTSLIQKNPACQKPHYDIILDTLIAIRNAPPPDLNTPTARQLCDATKLADDWYPGANSTQLDAFRAGLETVLQGLLAIEPTVSLRDFHADNIIWLDTRPPLQQPGLLDYQDAFLTHPAYDLMSLLTDARTDVSPKLREDMIDSYAHKAGDDVKTLTQAVVALGAQRNLRILGIFARAARSMNNTQHLPALPRVHRYLLECCKHPALAPFSTDMATAVPSPTPDLIIGLAP